MSVVYTGTKVLILHNPVFFLGTITTSCIDSLVLKHPAYLIPLIENVLRLFPKFLWLIIYLSVLLDVEEERELSF